MLDTHCYIGERKSVGRPRTSTSRPQSKRVRPKGQWAKKALRQREGHVHESTNSMFLLGADNIAPAQSSPPIVEITELSPISAADPEVNNDFSLLPMDVNETSEEASALQIYPWKSTHQSSRNTSVEVPSSSKFHIFEDDEAKLGRLYSELQTRGAMIVSMMQTLDFDAIVYRDSPLFLDNSTLANFVMMTSESFLQILERLQLSILNAEYQLRSTHQRLHSGMARLPQSLSGHLSPPLAAGITSVFSRLLYIYEFMIDRLVERIERTDLGPPNEMADLMPQDGSLKTSCAQGIFYCNHLHYLVDRMEHVLGLHEDQGLEEPSILSSDQIEILESVIDEYNGFGSNQGILRPADTKKLLKQITRVLKRIYT